MNIQKTVHFLRPSILAQAFSSSSFRCASSSDEPVEMENPYVKPPERCILCGVPVDYKNVQLLSQFVSSFTGLPYPRDKLNLCDKKYEEIQKAIKLSRRSGYMPFMLKEPLFHDDPILTTREKSRYLDNWWCSKIIQCIFWC